MAKVVEYNDKLYNLFGLKNKESIHLDDFLKIIDKTNLDAKQLKNLFPDLQICGCGKCSVNKSNLISYIKKHYLKFSDKPLDSYDFFQYNQMPKILTSFDFE